MKKLVLVLPVILLELLLGSCDSSNPSVQGLSAAGQIPLQRLAVGGALGFRDGSKSPAHSAHLRLTIGGMNLFQTGAGGCQPGDPHMPATMILDQEMSQEGRYGATFRLSDAASVTQPQCKIAPLPASSIDSLRLDVTLLADDQTCPRYCAALSDPKGCLSTCSGAGRLLQASRTLTRDDLDRLVQVSPDGLAQWKQDLVFIGIGPPISQGVGPDLAIDADAVNQSVHITQEEFQPGDCAIAEKCVGGPGSRTLLRFDGTTQNIGQSDLVLGDPASNPTFDFDACHQHYHLENIMLYELLSTDHQPVRVNGAGVVGRKQGFCMMDTEQVNASGAPSPVYDCSYQGISSGWADNYDSSLSCQWLDITGVPSGQYLLRVTVNPDGTFFESDPSNDSVEVPVTIP